MYVGLVYIEVLFLFTFRYTCRFQVYHGMPLVLRQVIYNSSCMKPLDEKSKADPLDVVILLRMAT